MANKHYYIPLQPTHYYTANTEVIFFFGNRLYRRYSERVPEKCIDELMNAEAVSISNFYENEEGDSFCILTRSFVLNVMPNPDSGNFSVLSIGDERALSQKKKYLYAHGGFTIFPNKSISIVNQYNSQSTRKLCAENYPESEEWHMEEEEFKYLTGRIASYFTSDAYKSTDKQVSRKFRGRVLQPIQDYARYEYIAEQNASFGAQYLEYDTCEFVTGSARSKVYDFVSPYFDPESEMFRTEDSVAVETNEIINDERKKTLNGRIVGRVLDEEGVRFRVEILDQFDDSVLVRGHGRIFPQVNRTQKRVRERVIRDIEQGNVPSKYMYKLFSDFETDGYEEEPGWNAFRDELLKKKYPPNASQMEAIRKGIETKDIQLVLGPPGTGKTTVIVSWIDFFVSHGKRVLISSQNNAAVDNVLERAGKNEKAKIIRLGNIDKIQENCKRYTVERQVDSTAEQYLSNLHAKKEILKDDITILKKKVMYIDKLLPYVEELDHCLERLQETSTFIRNAVPLLREYQEKEREAKEIKKRYERRMAAIRDYLDEFYRKNFLFRIANFELREKALEDYQSAKEAYDTYVLHSLNYCTEYNELSQQIQEKLFDPEYVEMKKRVCRLKEYVEAHAPDVKIKGTHQELKSGLATISFRVKDHSERLRVYQRYLVFHTHRLINILSILHNWEDTVKKRTNEIVTKLLIENSNVVGATCIGINTRRQFRDLKFDVSIIDESGQIQIHNAIVPMTRAPKTLMLGDHLQIPPMANEEVVSLCKQDGIKTDLLEMSFFEYLFTNMEKRRKNNPNLSRLDEQFRMPGNISDVISDWFYEGNYHANYRMEDWSPIVKGTNKPLVLISTSRVADRFEKTDEKEPGYCNPLEADIIAKIIAKVFEGSESPDAEQVGVISAYGKQVRLIREEIRKKKIGFTHEQIYSIAASLDSFQGQERPLILYSSTRSTDYKSSHQARVGFMKELRRLNVAFTRCQKQLIILGDFEYLTACEYEETDETGRPVKNKSEKKYAEFMKKMIEQAKSDQGEYYELEEFFRKAGIR